LKNRFKATELIKGVRKGESEKEEAFYLYASKIIWNVSYPFLTKLRRDMSKGNVKSISSDFLQEDVCNDIFLMILQQIKREPYIEIKQPAGYIRQVTVNYCRRLRSSERSLEFKDHIRQKGKIDIIEDYLADPSSLEDKTETKEEKIRSYYNQSFSPETKEGIDRTVSYLAFFYEAKKRLAESKSRDKNPLMIYERFKRLESDMKKITRRQAPSEEEIQRHLYLQNAPLELGTPELDKKTNGQMEELRALHDNYGYTLAEVYIYLYKIKRRLEGEMMFNDPVFLSLWTEPGETDPGTIKYWSDFIHQMPKMKADPANLLYLIWQKIDEIKRGSRRNQKKINLIFTYQKLNTAGTEKAFLFDSINPGIKKSTATSKRKAAYKEKLKARHYQDLTDFIFRKSFGPRI